jgi:hypothetical protein
MNKAQIGSPRKPCNRNTRHHLTKEHTCAAALYRI